MAKELYNGPLNKDMDFENPVGDGRPASGLAVQNYIKEIDSNKLSVGYTIPDGSAHLLFANESDRDEYLADTTKTYLIKDRIELEPMYYLTVNPLSPLDNTVFLGSVGNNIQYSFQTTNKTGLVITEPVTVKYTITRGGSNREVIQNYSAGTIVNFNIDNYLLEGTNSIFIEVTGQVTHVSATFGVVYRVVNLTLSDSMDISVVYRVNLGDENLQIPYTVSGVGQKTMEWYIDGERVPVDINADIINDPTASRTKYINIVELSQGFHSVQFRVGLNISGEIYYSNTLYREFIVSKGDVLGEPIVVTATEIPVSDGIISPSAPLVLKPTQFEPFPIRLAVYNPDGTYRNTVVVNINDKTVATVVCAEGSESVVTVTQTTTGEGILTLSVEDYIREIALNTLETTLNIHEITGDLVMNFTAEGKNNQSTDRATWTDGTHTATLNGFEWTNTSGWVDNNLLIQSGANVLFDLKPLSPDPIIDGKTIELEFKTINVDDEDATLINLINPDTGAGIKLTATEITVASRGGLNLNRRYKNDEDIRISIVINKSSGSTMSGLVSVYFNGILSMTQNFGESDSFLSQQFLSIGGVGAGINLRQVRIYDTALDSDSIINNYTLYRPTVDEMLSVYNRNDLYQKDSTLFDLDKIASYLPVMIITGDLTPIETAIDTKATTVVDIEYTNLQNPSYSFKMYHAQMRPQGTSSLTYPRKNLRLYTQKRDDTIVYDSEGKVVESRLYSFKPGAQPVNCWTIKADFAESSSTHNTGVARIWNDVMKQTQVGGQYVLRTEAQQDAIDNGYPYDVRTTVDGFPIVIFHRKTEEDPLTFLGKYNFNNDKSTESVFGFKGIPGFDNTNMQCWEFRDSGFDLALFKTPQSGRTYAEEFDYYASDYDKLFTQVWESRYPDTSSPNYDHFRRLAVWINSTEGASSLVNGKLVPGDPDKFTKWQTEKYQYFDLPKLAAYYVYLIRFGAVDQTVKNSMITTEDGEHWYFINYDNDTILGVRNDGLLKFGPEINRQSPDPELGGFAYAGHDSVLWNNFEADPECMEMVRTIDSALFTAGLTYNGMINMFNVEQAGKWAEKVYNQDAMYKYIEPYLYQDKNYLGSLQGSRSDHRKWWISNRFSLYDAIYANDSYNNNAITMLIPNAKIGNHFSIVSGKDFYYGWGQNRQPMETGVYVEQGQSHQFNLSMDFEIGTPLRIYAPHYINTLDLSGLIEFIGAGNFNLAPAYSETLGSKMKTLIMGVDDPVMDNRRNTALASPSGLARLISLENLNVAGYQALTTLDLSTLTNLKTFKGKASGLTSVLFANGAPLSYVELPLSMQSLSLEALPSLTADGIILEKDIDGKEGKNIYRINIHDCPGVTNDSEFFVNWLNNKTTPDEDCHVYMDNVAWDNISMDDLMKIAEFAESAGYGDGKNVNFRGYASIPGWDTPGASPIPYEQAEYLMSVFGPTVFNSNAAFYIKAPKQVYLIGPSEVLEGNGAQYQGVVMGEEGVGEKLYLILNGTANESINQDTGYLTTIEPATSPGDHTITVRLFYTAPDGSTWSPVDLPVTIVKRIYPTIDQVEITGPAKFELDKSNTYELKYLTEDITGNMITEWSVTGDLADYVEIVSQNKDQCVIRLTSTPSVAAVSGRVVATLKKAAVAGQPTVIAPYKDVVYQNESVAVSRATNQYFMDVLIAAEAAHPGQVMHPEWGDTNDVFSKRSAMLMTSDLFYRGSTIISSESLFYRNDFRTKCKNLDELQYFISLDKLSSGMFYQCTALEHLIIPSSVSSINENVFYGCTGLTSITLPSSLTNIGDSAFHGCIKLTSIELPSSLTTIGGYAFHGCNGLTSITIPEGVTSIGQYAFQSCIGLTHVTFNCNVPNYALYVSDSRSPFYQCTNINSVTIGDGVTTIGENAFYGRTWLTSIELPSSLTNIGNSAFHGCIGLTSIELPSSLTTIGISAFGVCTGLTSIELPSSLTTIKQYAFQSCTGLTHVTFNCNVPDYALSIITNSSPFYQCTNINSVTIGDGVTTIGSSAFRECTWLTSIELPSSLTTIGSSAFYSCTGLTSIELPSPLTSIGGSAFSSCTGLTHVTFNCNVPNYALYIVDSDSPFYQCTNINSVAIGEGVTSIGIFAFYHCTWMTSIELPSSLTTIGRSAFYNCTGLTSITIPEGVTSIDQNVFRECTGLTSIELPSSLTTIGNEAFRECTGLTSITIPEGVTSIGSSAFYNCTGLTSIELPSSLTTIMNWTFGNVGQNLASIIVDENNPTYNDGNGSNCIIQTSTNKLLLGCKNTVIPSNVIAIENYAFYCCTGLTSVNIPINTTSISYISFYRCPDIESITVEVGNSTYHSQNNCVIQTSNNNLLLGCKNTIIPSYVNSIGEYAFDGCTGLTSITLPSSLTTINLYAFQDCTGLTSITIPEGVRNVSNLSFIGCINIAEISVSPDNQNYNDGNGSNCIISTSNNYLILGCKNTIIPSSVTTINIQAFDGCTGLTSITIPEGVTSIGEYAFSGCTGLTSITLPSSLTTISRCAFQACTGLTHVTFNCNVPGYALYITVSNSPFYQCTNINSVTIGEGVTSIGGSAFTDCTWLTSIELPSSLTTIGISAFNGCTGLMSIELSSSLTTIENFAFYGCTGLTSIELPSSLTTINQNAFLNCNNLSTITSHPTTPPTIQSSSLPSTSVVQHIYVPSESVEAYRVASNWTVYAGKISGIV